MSTEIIQTIDVNLGNSQQKIGDLRNNFTDFTKSVDNSGKSVEELQKDVKELTAEINSLSAAQRNAQVGKVLSDELKQAQTELKAATEDVKQLTLASEEAGNRTGNAFTKAFSSLRTLAYILPGIGLAGIFNLAFEGIGNLFTKTDDTVKKLSEDVKTYQSIVSGVIDSHAKETGEVDILVNRLQSGNVTRKESIELIDKLQKVAPDYFATLNKETASISDVTRAYGEYNKQLLASIEAQIRVGEITELAKKRLDISNQTPDAANYISTLQAQGKTLEEISAIVAKGTQTEIDGQAKILQGSKYISDEQLKQQLLTSKIPYGVQTIVDLLQREKALLDQINDANLKSIGVTQKAAKPVKEKVDDSEDKLKAAFQKEQRILQGEQLNANQTLEEQLKSHYDKQAEIGKSARNKALDAENDFYNDSISKAMAEGRDLEDIEADHLKALAAINKKFDESDAKQNEASFKKALKDAKALSDAKMAIKKEEQRQQIEFANSTSDLLDQLSQAAGENTQAGKDLAIASATIKAFATVANIIESFSTLGPWGVAAGIATGAATLVGLFNNIKKIEAVEIPGQSSSSSSASAGLSGGAIAYNAPAIPTANNSTNLSAQSIQQINQANSAPVRAYVVEQDITAAQARIASYRDASRISAQH